VLVGRVIEGLDEGSQHTMVDGGFGQQGPVCECGAQGLSDGMPVLAARLARDHLPCSGQGTLAEEVKQVIPVRLVQSGRSDKRIPA